MANVLRSIGNWFGGLWDRWQGSGWGRVRFLMPGSTFDWEAKAGDPWSNSVVALALKWKSDRFSIPRMRVSRIGRNGSYVPLPRHAMIDLWERPNPYYDRMVIEAAVGLSVDVDGNAFVWKRRSKLGKVVELWWVPHWSVAPVYPSDGSRYLDAWRVSVNGEERDVPPEDMIHVRVGIDPRNDRLGLSPLKAQFRELCTVNEESGFTAALLMNCGVPGLVAMPANEMGRIDKEPGKIIKEQLKDLVSGDRRGDPVVLSGATRLEVLGFSPEQLRLDKLPQNAVARIAAAEGTAAMSLGLPDPNKTYANLSEANRSSWSTIKATQTRIARALRWQLLNEFDDPYKHVVEHDYSDIDELKEDLDSLHHRAREDYKAGLLMRNEARDLIGYEPDPDGDVFYPGTGGEPGDDVIPKRSSGLAPPEEPDEPIASNGHAKGWHY